MTDFPMCQLCGHTVAITRERDETKPTPEELRAEIERLWAVLERIAEYSDDEWAFTEARRALEPKP